MVQKQNISTFRRGPSDHITYSGDLPKECMLPGMRFKINPRRVGEASEDDQPPL